MSNVIVPDSLSTTTVLDTLFEYYRLKLRDNALDTEMPDGGNGTIKLRPDKKDLRHQECAYSLSIYLELLKRLTSKDFNYAKEMGEVIYKFYNEIRVGYGKACKQNGPQSSMFFLIGMRMMEDVIDYIGACTDMYIEHEYTNGYREC